MARTVFVCPVCEEILCINSLFPFIVFLTQQQQVDIYELKMQTPEQWEHRDSCGGGNVQTEDYPAQGNCKEATLRNYPQWAADGSRERESGFPPDCRFNSGQELCRNSSDSYK